MKLVLFLLIIFAPFIFAHDLSISRPLDLSHFLSTLSVVDPFHVIVLSHRDLLVAAISSSDGHSHALNFFFISNVQFMSTHSSIVSLSSTQCFYQQSISLDNLEFSYSHCSFINLKTQLHSSLTEDIILIAFEFYSSNLNNQFDQLSLKVFSLLNLQESNTFEFIVENDLMSLFFNEFSLEQDQSIIANITITHNSNQCTTEFPHEVQFNSIVSCSFCISNTGYTNTSSLQSIDKRIELQTNMVSYCSFLKESVSLFLFVSDYKLVIRDVIQRRSLELATPLSGVRSVDFISSLDSKSFFMVFICNENHYELRVVTFDFETNQLKSDTTVIELSVSHEHSAAVLIDGTVKTWGQGSFGRLGSGDTSTRYNPMTVDGITDAVSVSCGREHTLVLRSNGLLYAFGYNTDGRLGDGLTSHRFSRISVLDLFNVIAISAAETHSIALRGDGMVFSWGSNVNGRLGRAVTVNQPATRPGLITELSNVITISAGSFHSLAVRSDGTVAGFGQAGNGRLGNGQTLQPDKLVQACGSFTTAVNVSAGQAHSLVLLQGGDLWSTGWNYYGQLGLGHIEDQTSPVQISGFQFAAVSAGADSNIGVLTNGDVVVWGANFSWQLGDGTNEQKTIPFVLSTLSGLYTFSIDKHALVASKNGTIFGWGNNNYGKIGDGTNHNHVVPVEITGLKL
ncbi:hypothetical protein RCL1_008835 [Eukaryota sp. TZLM3-RCL]